MIKFYFTISIILILLCFYRFERKQNVNFLYSEGENLYLNGNAIFNVYFQKKDCLEIINSYKYIVNSSNNTTIMYEIISDNIINHIRRNNTPPEINLHLNKSVKSRMFTIKGNGVVNFKNDVNIDSLYLKVINNGSIINDHVNIKTKLTSCEILNNGMISLSNLYADSISYYVPKNGYLNFK